MGTVSEKLTYTLNAVNDIQSAIIEKGVAVSPSVELAEYGNKIRQIESGTIVVPLIDCIQAIECYKVEINYAQDVIDVTNRYV